MATLMSIARMRYVISVNTYCLSLTNILFDLLVQDGTTALCYAAMRGHSEIVRYLAETKADVDLPDEVGYY